MFFWLLKKKKNKVNIEVLKLEYDVASKLLILVNTILILFLSLYYNTASKFLNEWNYWDWWMWGLVILSIILEWWVITKWVDKFLELREELEKL